MDNSDIVQKDLSAWRTAARRNFFSNDRYFQNVLRTYFPSLSEDMRRRLESVGETAAGLMNDLAIESNRDENLPWIRHTDEFGNRVEQIVFHPSYHDLGRMIWATGVLEVLSQPGHDRPAAAITYLISHNGEAGHVCPVACTAGAIKLIQRLGSSDQKEYLLRLLNPDYNRRVHASQFLTEIQGGSDVGSNVCRAQPVEGQPGLFRIYGKKWFCSVADAGLFVVTARPEGAGPGTRGLGLFLVPRHEAGVINGFSLRRLKYKLGTRSMATAEIEFNGALGSQIGELSDGFKNVVGIVLDTSRLYNAVAACGMMRRAFIEAFNYAQYRRAFGRPILEYPPVRRTLSRMKTLASAALSNTFRILKMTDTPDTGGDRLVRARRIDVSINKYRTSVSCTGVVRDAIEILGGNGTIEDFSILPRLYRDSIVIESWEGTHNTLCMQVLRDFVQRGMHVAWLEVLRESIQVIRHPSLSEYLQRARVLERQITDAIERVLSSDEGDTASMIRPLVDRMWLWSAYVGMLRVCDTELESGCESSSVEVLEYFDRAFIKREDPLETGRIKELEDRISSVGMP